MNLLAVCNPLLDIQTSDSALLAKYALKGNDAILASPEQMGIYSDILFSSTHPAVSLPGGSGQNTARSAALLLGSSRVTYLGSVGDDDYARILREANEAAGVKALYQVIPGAATGTCACIVKGSDRSLITNLGAAEKFSPDHLKTPDVKAAIAAASFTYISGFFLTHGLGAALELCKLSAERGTTVLLNLSAPFICQYFRVQLEEILPYVDILISNDSEAVAWGESAGEADTSPASVAKVLAAAVKTNASRPRTVIVTCGSEPTIVATTKTVSGSSPGVHVKSFPVPPVPKEEIVDANGAGDAFVGGLIAELCEGKSLEKGIETGHYLAGISLRQIGANMPSKLEQK